MKIEKLTQRRQLLEPIDASQVFAPTSPAPAVEVLTERRQLLKNIAAPSAEPNRFSLQRPNVEKISDRAKRRLSRIFAENNIETIAASRYSHAIETTLDRDAVAKLVGRTYVVGPYQTMKCS